MDAIFFNYNKELILFNNKTEKEKYIKYLENQNNILIEDNKRLIKKLERKEK